MLLILALSTGLALALDNFDIRSETILLVFVLAILIITLLTDKIYYPLCGSILSIFIFNFFFTEPRFSFVINDPNYYISLVIFLVATTCIYSLTSRMQQQIVIRKENEERLKAISRFDSKLINANGLEEIILLLSNSLKDFFHERVTVLKVEDKKIILDNIDIDSETLKAFNLSINNNEVVGGSTVYYSNFNKIILPLSYDQNIVVALVSINFTPKKKYLSSSETDFVNSLMLSSKTAIQKEMAIKDKEKTSLEIQKEKFKSNILRSLSHDIKTPLTAIQTGLSLLLESHDKIDEKTRKSMLEDMNKESIRLTNYVENLLAMTRFSANEFKLNKKNELVSDILDEAISEVKEHLGDHKIKSTLLDDSLTVNLDSALIEQVMRNLINNAIFHSKNNSNIEISAKEENNYIVFSVVDDGGGLSKEVLDNLFLEFSTIAFKQGDRYRGSGLGLSICKSIVEAHNGTIIGFNNDCGGASFVFKIPKE